ncbi:hypothetical protein SAMD00023353_0701490 [Rosellinia necatrix]|uniref:Uncharacterized protein n=1 Tax=Rosellinia necatrix TaxID=77044 RepID=A0A1S7ULX5_ROSNE|nr:hypothetical protein SAMD00023353_0701490 [Rosellinia necatrix]
MCTDAKVDTNANANANTSANTSANANANVICYVAASVDMASPHDQIKFTSDGADRSQNSGEERVL